MTLIKSKGVPASSKLKKLIFLQILNAIDTLHSQLHLAHLDLKLENLLLSSTNTILLCDFGFCAPLNIKLHASQGTDGYKAPEVEEASVLKAPYEPKAVDMFALGVLLFIVEFGSPPFRQAVQGDCLYRHWYKGPRCGLHFWKSHPSTAGLMAKDAISLEMIDLVNSMLNPNPKLRPQSIEEVRQNACFKLEGKDEVEY